MSIGCSRSRIWLHRTFEAWTHVQRCQHVSTTSAINRGLRATRREPFPERGGKFRARTRVGNAVLFGRRHRQVGSNNDAGDNASAGRPPTSSKQRRPKEPQAMSIYPSSPPLPSFSGKYVMATVCTRLRELLTTINVSEHKIQPPPTDSLREAAALVSALNENWKVRNESEQGFSMKLRKRIEKGMLEEQVLFMRQGEQAEAVGRERTVAVWRRTKGNKKGWEVRLMGPSGAFLGDSKGGWKEPEKGVGFEKGGELVGKRVHRPTETDRHEEEKDFQKRNGDYGYEPCGLLERSSARETRSVRRRNERTTTPSHKPSWSLGRRKQAEEDDDDDNNHLDFPDRSTRDIKSTQQRNGRSTTLPQKRSLQDQQQEKDEDDSSLPISVPYTTAASTFLYGFNPIIAALKARRRKIYRLYLHPRASSREDKNSDKESQTVQSLSKSLSIPTEHNTDVRLLNRIAGNRPHNGVVLECSKLPAPPVLSLGKPDTRTNILPLRLDRQSAEDVAVHGAPAAVPILTKSWRHPFVVMLDGITDPGNLGSILRTAHFYGVDAVAVATNTCAPLDSVAVKASSGACEAVRIFALPKPSGFIYDSVKNGGWRIYAASPPPSGTNSSSSFMPSNKAARRTTSAAIAVDSPLAKHPCILMLGAEGEGLRANLVRRADVLVSVEQGEREAQTRDVGVESLNVGVAAGVLMESFLRKPVEGKGGGGLGF